MQWILVFILFLAACNKSVDPAISASDATLAQVNDTRITVDQFNQKWSQLPDAVRPSYAGPNGRKDFLGELITRELLLDKAHRMKLDQDKVLTNRVADFKDRLLLDAALHELVEKKIEVTEDDLTAYFNAHRDSLPTIEEARAAHILVETEAEAKTLLKRLHQGADFGTLAGTHSIDVGSKDKGGDVGVVRKGRMLPEIEAAVFGLKPGRISGIVKTAYGYHIVRVQNRQTRRPLTVGDVKDEIQKAIAKNKETALFEALVKTLKTESKILISDSLLASLGENVAPDHDTPSAPRR